MTVVSRETANDRISPAWLPTETLGQYQKAAYVFMGLLIVYALARSFAGAAAKPFWIDEFCTLAVAGQPGVHGIWSALKRGIDSAPPLFYVIEAASLKISSNKEIALRLPSIVAFPCTLLCVFAYVRRRSGDLIACLCPLLLLSTTLFTIYATEGRPYSMVVACIALALVCYQRLPSRGWTVLLAISLLLAENLHYFAVIAMVPFWLAEGVALLRARSFRVGVWAALACGILPIFIFWPLLSGYRAFYGSHIVFSHPVLSRIPEYWGSFFLIDPPFGAALALVSLVAIGWSRIFPAEANSARPVGNGRDVIEATLLVGLNILPIIAFILVRLTHAILTNRYMLAATVGIVLGMACVLSLARPKIVALFALFVLASVGWREYGYWRNGHHAMAGDLTVIAVAEFAHIEEFVQLGGHLDLPVVYGPALPYARIAYYGARDWNGRVLYLLDDEKELSYVGNDTNVKMMLALRDFLPLRVVEYSEFIKTHEEFLMYSEAADWTLVALNREAASMQLVEVQGDRRLYLVKMKGDAVH